MAEGLVEEKSKAINMLWVPQLLQADTKNQGSNHMGNVLQFDQENRPDISQTGSTV